MLPHNITCDHMLTVYTMEPLEFMCVHCDLKTNLGELSNAITNPQISHASRYLYALSEAQSEAVALRTTLIMCVNSILRGIRDNKPLPEIYDAIQKYMGINRQQWLDLILKMQENAESVNTWFLLVTEVTNPLDVAPGVMQDLRAEQRTVQQMVDMLREIVGPNGSVQP